MKLLFDENLAPSLVPLKVVWIRRGNCTTRHIEFILCNKLKDIRSLVDNPESTYLVIL